jgi:hypothetical protein
MEEGESREEENMGELNGGNGIGKKLEEYLGLVD